MIQVLLELDEKERLLFFDASGHACCGAKGHDIVCAAVTVLLRTTVQALQNIRTETAAGQPGFLSCKVLDCDERYTEQLRYAAKFLWLGISSLQKEYPQAVQCKKIQR